MRAVPVMPAWVVLFLRFLAFGHILDEAQIGSTSRVTTWLIMVGAGVFIALPSAWWALGMMAAAKCWFVISHFPFLNNHDLITLLLDAGVLVLLVVAWRRGLGAWSAPGVRFFLQAALVVTYGAAAVSKLNSGFFDPVFSCGVDLYVRALQPFGDAATVRSWLPGWLERSLPPVVAGIELSVPLLLVIRRTRHLGVAVAVTFHLILSLSPTAIGLPFTVILLPALVPFLSERAAAGAVAAWQRRRATWDAWRARYLRASLDRLMVPAGALVLAGIALLSAQGRIVEYRYAWWLVLSPVAFFLGAVLLSAIGIARGFPWSGDVDEDKPSGRLPVAAVVVMSSLFVPIAGAMASPYVGAGTVPAFTMYSNLRTEEGRSNHTFLPRLSVLDTQDDLVRVLQSDGTAFIRRTDQSGAYVTMHEVRREVAAAPGGWIEVERLSTGEVMRVSMPDGPSFGDRVGFKLVRHRPVFIDGPACQW